MLHPYCVRRADDPAPGAGLRGVAGAGVEVLREGELALWVSRGGAPAATVDRLREHDVVVRAALRTATPLPVRYGAGLADAEEACRLLRERREEFLAALERVAGRVEMGLRLRWDPGERRSRLGQDADPPGGKAGGGPGRAYLERRRREFSAEAALRGEAERLLDGVEAVFADLELQSARTLLPAPDVPGVLAHLVHRSMGRAYRERVARARARFPHIEVQPSGPWAPYSFT